MLKKLAYREGIGDILAEGPIEAARKFGKEAIDYAVRCV